MSLLSLIIRETSQIYSSKFHVINKCVTLVISNLIINILSLIFYDKKAKSLKKNEIKIRVSNLVKQNLRHMDAYDGATAE